MSIEGDLRFGSHKDMMRVMARTVRRAALPVRYSEGFNPHPRLSLACPRPVGVATRDDLLVATLDEPVEGEAMLRQLNCHAPRGLRFTRARMLDKAISPQPLRACYELAVMSEALESVGSRLAELELRPAWPIERCKVDRRGRPSAAKTIDLRPLVERLSIDGDILRAVLVRRDDRWARPAEILELVALDPRVDLARMVRTEVQYRIQSPCPDGRSG